MEGEKAKEKLDEEAKASRENRKEELSKSIISQQTEDEEACYPNSRINSGRAFVCRASGGVWNTEREISQQAVREQSGRQRQQSTGGSAT